MIEFLINHSGIGLSLADMHNLPPSKAISIVLFVWFFGYVWSDAVFK